MWFPSNPPVPVRESFGIRHESPQFLGNALGPVWGAVCLGFLTRALDGIRRKMLPSGVGFCLSPLLVHALYCARQKRLAYRLRSRKYRLNG